MQLAGNLRLDRRKTNGWSGFAACPAPRCGLIHDPLYFSTGDHLSMKHLNSRVFTGAVAAAAMIVGMRRLRWRKTIIPHPPLFQHGDVVCFLGDSLTQTG